MALTKTLVQRCFRSIYRQSIAKYRFCTETQHKDELEGNVATYYGKNQNYASLFGTNIHFGYFPHISDQSQPVLNFGESGTYLNEHMVKVAGINENSNVCDFGCGVGGPIFEVSQLTNCRATGVDLTPEFIDQANVVFAPKSDKMKYEVGSITQLPESIKNAEKFSHIFSIQAICHITRFAKDVFNEAHSVLEENGKIVLNDFVVAENGPSDKAQKHFYKRLHFDELLSFADYAELLTQCGFDIIHYENCTKHAEYGYMILDPIARETKRLEADGLLLADHYYETSECMKRGEIGMVVIVAQKK